MPILNIIIVLIVIGVLLWAVTNYIPMNDTIKRILIGVVIVITVIWLLQVFGILGSLKSVHTSLQYIQQRLA
jgi:cytochrome c biogenesis protein CcdA